MRERPLSHVPWPVVVILATALTLHFGIRLNSQPGSSLGRDLPPAPSGTMLKLASLGDPSPVSRMLMLYVQSFDMRADNRIRYQAMNYATLEDWLSRILELDAHTQYPLLLASRVYAEVPDPSRQRSMLEFIYQKFLADPDRRWAALAHATFIAKHKLKDLPLARRYAAAIQSHVHGDNVPLWAKQMEAFILEDMNELEAAKIMIGGFIASGAVKDPDELQFLAEKLRELESKTETQNRPKSVDIPSDLSK